jgi:hypothetical protein
VNENNEQAPPINMLQKMTTFTQQYSAPFVRGSSNQMYQELKRLGILNDSGSSSQDEVNDGDMPLPTYLDHPSTKCDEL